MVSLLPHAIAALLAAAAIPTAQDPVSPPPQEAPRLSLEEAVVEALHSNDRIIDLQDSADQADLQVRLARTAFHPHLVPNIAGTLGQSDLADQTYSVDLQQKLPFGTELYGTIGATSFQNQIGTYYSSDTTLQVKQPLLKGRGSAVTRRTLDSAEERLRTTALDRQISAQRIAVQVASAYYRIVSQTALVAVAEKSLERSRSLLEASEAKLAIGKVSQLDLARARQLVAQAEGQLLDAKGAVLDAQDSLRDLLGREGTEPFSVDPTVPSDVEGISEETAEATALKNRPEIHSSQAAVDEAERNVHFAKNQLLPQFDVSLALTRRETGDTLVKSLGVDHFRVAAFFNVSLPVDRRPQQIEYSNALIERDRRTREERTTERRIAIEARQAARRHERLRRSLEVAEAAVESSRTEVEVARMRYEQGLSNNLDVVTAETSLLGAEGRVLSTRADLAVSRLDLRATLGILDPVADIKRAPSDVQ